MTEFLAQGTEDRVRDPGVLMTEFVGPGVLMTEFSALGY